METGYRQAMADQHNSPIGFIVQLLANPLSLVLTLSIVFMVLGQTQLWSKARGRFFHSRGIAREGS
jgi:putative tricarboxylic transport membrane protein